MSIIRNLRKDFDEGRMDNLRSLRYEDSGIKAPYVTKQEGSSSNEISKRIDDASRIAQMLIDKPGVKHLANEALLKQGELTKKLEGNNGTLVGNVIRRAGGTLKHVAQVAGSTLSQVPVNGTGTHFLRAFRTDTYLQENDATSGFGQFFGAGGVEGAQYALRGERIPAEALVNGSKLPLRNTTANRGELGQTNIGVEGDISVDTDIAKYNSALTYTGTSTNENIANVVGGAHVNKSELLGANTTASPGDLGSSIESANTNISGSLTSEVENSKYSSSDSYTGTNTIDNAANVNRGQSITKPSDLTRNTTPSPGSLGIDKKDIVGDVTENVSVAQGNYRPDTPYTETDTVTNIVNANNGNPINNPAGTGLFDETFAVQTTSLEGTFGVTNKAIKGDISDPVPERSKITLFDKNQLEAGGGRTKLSTLDNINHSRKGSKIPLLGTPTRPNDNYYQKGTVTLFNTGDEQFKEYLTSGNAPVEDRKKLIDLNPGEDGIGIGTITSLPKQFEQKYNDLEGASYIKQSTELNSFNAQSGTPITNKSVAGPTPVLNTTLKKGDIPNSTSNRGVLGDIVELNPKFDNKYRDGESKVSYTRKSTFNNINAAQSGSIIAPRLNVGKDTINKSSTSIEQAKEDPKQYNGQLGSTSLGSGKQIQDFRSKDSKNKFNGGTTNTYPFDYSGRLINKETRVGLGNPGKIQRNRTSYNIPDSETVDKLNMLDVSDTALDAIALPEIGKNGSRDLIQLEFQVLTPEQTYYLGFRAFLDTFDDSFNGSWNTHRYLGRADNFYTYSGFDRSITIGFKIAAQSQDEMEPLYRKAATLASVTAPTYGQGGRFMRGSIAKVTVGDYIYEQPGIIESVQYKWQKDYPWEISFENPENKDGNGPQILPHVLDVSVSFKVIHDFLPETGTNPLITNYKADINNKKVYIPLKDREFIIPESASEKRERIAKEQAADRVGIARVR